MGSDRVAGSMQLVENLSKPFVTHIGQGFGRQFGLAKREFLTIKFPALAFDARTDGRAYITPDHRQRAERWADAELPGRLAAPQVRRILR
jgi:hypothetical protein